jgi:hypothetical protein
MNKHVWAGAFAIILAATFTLAGRSDNTNTGSWSGLIINGSCNADEAFAEATKCTAEAPSASLALYDDTIRQVFALDPQDQAKGHLGEAVTVQGALEGSAIHVASLQKFSEVGLRAGQKAPDFFPCAINLARYKLSTPCEDQKAPSFCFTVPPIGALTAKASSFSCRRPKNALRNKESSWRGSVTTAWRF